MSLFNGTVLVPRREVLTPFIDSGFTNQFADCDLSQGPLESVSGAALAQKLAMTYDQLRYHCLDVECIEDMDTYVVSARSSTGAIVALALEETQVSKPMDLLELRLAQGDDDSDSYDEEVEVNTAAEEQRGAVALNKSLLEIWLEEVIGEDDDNNDASELIGIAKEEDSQSSGDDHREVGSDGEVGVDDADEIEPWDAFLARLEIEQAHVLGTRLDLFPLGSLEGDPPRFGCVHRMHRRGVMGTCNVAGHRNCKAWVEPKIIHSDDALWRDVIEWVSTGRTRNPKEHQVAAFNLKKSWGMNPRPLTD